METEFYAVCKGSDGVFKYYRDGEWMQSSSGKVVPILNPCTNEKAFEVQGGLGAGWGERAW